MSFELVFTSARRGLRAGASGFCTVAATEGIPRNLQAKLESMSGYQQPELTRGRTPPINFAHTTIRIQRNVYHVLSRIGRVRRDHTNRSNKIAHHLALTTSECRRLSNNPAALFADSSFWYETWDDDPQSLPPDRFPETDGDPGEQFSAWEDAFGDAGWAGPMGAGISEGFKTVSVIIPDTTIAPRLVEEAFQLVKPENRWKVCFSTHYSRQTSGDQCHWRFVLDDTSEARKIRARPMGLLIDPLNSRAELPDGPFVEAARNGTPDAVFSMVSQEDRRRISIRQSELEVSAKRNRSDDDDDDDDDESQLRPSLRRRRERARKKKESQYEKRSPFDVDEREYAGVRVGNEPQDEEPQRRKSKGRRGKKLSPAVILVLGLTGLLIVIVALIGFNALG